MLSQWFYGFHLEQLYTTKKFAILYFASAIGGNLLSAIKNTDNISVGASSALFGIFAFQVAYLIDNYENLGPRKNVQIFVIAIMLFANVGSASTTTKVDNSAHLGGFLAGALIAIYYMGSNAESKFKKYHRKVIFLLAAYFLITTVWLVSMVTIENAAAKAEGFSKHCKETYFKLW